MIDDRATRPRHIVLFLTAYLDLVNCGSVNKPQHRHGDPHISPPLYSTLSPPTHSPTLICAELLAVLCCPLQPSFYSFVQRPFIWLLGPELPRLLTTN